MHFRKSLFAFSVIVCLFLYASAFADQSGDFTYTVSGSTVTITGYTGSSRTVVMPSTINSMPVVCIDSDAIRNNFDSTTVIVPASVTNVYGITYAQISGAGLQIWGYPSFVNCPNLGSIYFLGDSPQALFSPCPPRNPPITGYCMLSPDIYVATELPLNEPNVYVLNNVYQDVDVDNIPDNIDNCPNKYNPQQLDADKDGIGDVCDSEPNCGGCGMVACENVDRDYDGIIDNVDNCPDVYNPQQFDADNDGIGDCCDLGGCSTGCGLPACDTVCSL